MKNDNKNYKKKAEKILFLFLVGIILYSSLVLSSPTMNITSPLNQTYNSQTIFNLNYTTTLDTISSWYSVNKGVTNVSFANLSYIIAFDNFTANFTSGFGWASTWSNSSFNKTGIITLNGSQTARVSNATLFNRHFNASLFAGKNVTITFGAGTNTTKNCSYYFYTNDTSSVLLLTLNSTTSVGTITNYSFDLSSQDFSKNSSFGVLPSTPSNITDYCFLNNVNISSTIPSLSTSGINANQGSNFWQVFGNSSTGIGSANLSFFVDTIAPVFNIIPVNLSINYSLPINVQFNITDNLQVSYVFVNNTRFNITQNDILTNATALSVGTYLINISANDTLNNVNSTIYKITINQIVPILNLTITSLNILYGNQVNITGTCPSQLTCNLYVNNSLVSNPYSNVYIFGNYSIVYNTTGNQNYSANNIANILVVYDNVSALINLISPSDNFISNNGTQNFVVNSTDYGSGLQNMTLFIYNTTNIPVHVSNCYQEDTTNLSQSNSSCSKYLFGTGGYDSWSGSTAWWGGCSAICPYTDKTQCLHDGNWSTCVGINPAFTSGSIAWNYTKPLGAVRQGTIWVVADDVQNPILTDGTRYNLTIPSDCWNAYPDKLRFQVFVNDIGTNSNFWSCWNGTQFNVLRVGQRIVYEDSIYWNISLDSNGTLVNQTSINLNDTSIVSNFLVNLIDNIYIWFANVFDIAGNKVISGNNTLTIDTISPSFNTIPSNSSINYLQSLSVQFNITDLHLSTISLNDSRFSINSSEILINATSLGVGTYFVNISASDSFGNINFIIYQVIVNKIASQTSLNFDKSSPQSYGTAITPICSLITGLGSVSLINGTSGIPETLGVNTWNFNCSYAGNQNYTSSSNQTYFTISKSNSNCQVFFNITSPKAYTTKFLVYTDCDSNFNLYRNGTSITNNSVQSLSIGTYNFSVFRIDTQNYSNIFNESDFILISAVPNLSLSFFPSNSVLYGTSMNVSGLGCPSEITCNLYKDGIFVSNPYLFNSIYGTNNFVYNTSGNVNYSANSVSGSLDVFDNIAPSGNAVSPIGNTSSPVHFIVNASDNGSTLKNITYNIFNSTGLFNKTSVNVTGTTATTNILFDLIDGVYNWFASIFDLAGNLFNTLNATILVDKTPPNVTIINPFPYDRIRPIGKVVGIDIKDSDLHGISHEYGQLQYPNLTYVNFTFTNGLQDDNFINDNNWDTETNSPNCIMSIANGKMNTFVNGTYNNKTDFICSYISKDVMFNDFDTNVTFDMNKNLTNDSEINFEISGYPSSTNTTTEVFMSLSYVSGFGSRYEIFGEDGNNSGYIMQRSTSDTYGKFRIKRIGNNFYFYTWNNTNSSWNNEIVSNNHFSFANSTFVIMESENFYDDFGIANVSWTNFSVVSSANRIHVFEDTLDVGSYDIRIFVNDTFGNINDSQLTFFRINSTNQPPTSPFLLTPVINSIDFGSIPITWTQSTDPNNDFLKYNITLLNPDLSFNKTIVTGYGDSSSTSYSWNSTGFNGSKSLFANGEYTMLLQVYEAITPEHYTKSSYLQGNFTLDNTISCNPENFTGMKFSVPTYPYVDLNSTYQMTLLSPINPYSNIELYLTEPNGTIDEFPFNFIDGQYTLGINFDKIGDYSFIISGKSLCVNITDNITGTFLVRNPYYVTICGFNDKSGTAYKNNFAVLSAEFSNPHYDANLDKFITPLGFATTFKTPVFHTDYTNGCGTLKLYDPSTYTLRLFDGQTSFLTDYSQPNITKSYGTNILIGQQKLNGTSENLAVYLSPSDIRPYFSLFNWILIIVLVMSIIIAIFMFFVIPEHPQIALTFGLIMVVGSILLRIIMWFYIG